MITRLNNYKSNIINDNNVNIIISNNSLVIVMKVKK